MSCHVRLDAEKVFKVIGSKGKFKKRSPPAVTYFFVQYHVGLHFICYMTFTHFMLIKHRKHRPTFMTTSNTDGLSNVLFLNVSLHQTFGQCITVSPVQL